MKTEREKENLEAKVHKLLEITHTHILVTMTTLFMPTQSSHYENLMLRDDKKIGAC